MQETLGRRKVYLNQRSFPNCLKNDLTVTIITLKASTFLLLPYSLCFQFALLQKQEMESVFDATFQSQTLFLEQNDRSLLKN